MITSPEQALSHLQAVDQTVSGGEKILRQAAKDTFAAGANVVAIAAALNTTSRGRIAKMINEPGPEQIPKIALTPVVFLRGPKLPGDVWKAVTAAMHSRGWPVVRDRAQAWHLARGRVPVVLVDMAADQCAVGLVKAKFDDAGEQSLPLVREWTIVDELDADQLALAVIDQLHPLPSISEPAEPASLRPAEVDQLFPLTPSTSRRLQLSQPLWEQVRTVADRWWNEAGYADLRAVSRPSQDFLVHALAEKITGIQQTYNEGRPLPVDEAIGRNALAKDQFEVKVLLPLNLWEQICAAVAAGHARSPFDLVDEALADKLRAQNSLQPAAAEPATNSGGLFSN